MDKIIEMELRKWIDDHEEELVRDIGKLVEIPSVSRPGDELPDSVERAALCMMEMAGRYGLKAELCDNCCVRLSYGTGEKEVQVWGHLDVVPAGEGWVYPPWKCTRKGDFLIGRGVSDNKGAVIAVLYCLRYMKEHNVELCYSLSQICGLSEETGMADADRYLAKWPAPDFAFVSDCRFPLCYGEKGRCVVTLVCDQAPEGILDMAAGESLNSVPGEAVIKVRRSAVRSEVNCIEEKARRLGVRLRTEVTDNTAVYTVKGIPGHAAAPERCENPIGLAGMILKRDASLGKAEARCMEFLETACLDGYGKAMGIHAYDPVFENLTCAGTMLKMEDRRISLTLDIRYQPSVAAASMREQMQKAVEPYGFVVAAWESRDGYCSSMESDEISALLYAYECVVNDGKKPYVMGGNTYAGRIPNAVCFGPGIPKDPKELGLPDGHGGGHGCDEIQAVSSLKKAIEVYVHAFFNLNDVYGE